ncbi:MAG: ABC transporter ATP-binding protein [Abitibacteriaceae bacterium]|nr:ABC transporter ATP-binding protein [Abditibacteriaceae bacterium]
MDNVKRLLPYVRPHLQALLLGAICMVLSAVLGGVFVLLAKDVLGPMLNGGPAAERLYKLDYFTILVLAVSLLRMVTDYGQTYITQRTGQRVLARLRLDLFSHFQALSVGFFEQRRTGEILSRMTNDLGALQSILTLAVVTTISSPLRLVIYIGLMVHFNWRLSLFVLVVLPPVALLISATGRRIKVATTSLQRRLAELTNYLQERVAAMRLIQTFGTKDYEIQLFEQVNHETFRSTMKPIRIQAVLSPAIEFTGMLGVLLSLWFGGRDVIAGHMQSEALLTFLFSMQQVAMQVKSISGLNLMVRQADAAAARLFEILDTKPEVCDVPDAIDLSQREVRGHIVFDDVYFSYQTGPEVLHGISFEIKPDEVVALAGLSGSGKTTISALVPRLYDPTKGKVLVDGHDLRDVSMASLRAHIGAVPQETILFHGTIRDNIAYGRPQATLEQIVEAARRANADDFIRAQPEGYDTQIGERGGRLSGGQRQRIAIARAFLRDPRILILDEATSSLDAESESKVQEALAKLMEGRTTLIIAHRFSTIQHADRILVLDNGCIAESGKHEELLQQRGRYYSLYQMQAFASRHGVNEQALDGEAKDSAA